MTPFSSISTPTSSPVRSRRGFTLVEVMVSMLLVAIFMASVMGLVTQVTRSSMLVRERSEATALGWSRLERARITDFDKLDELNEEAPGVVVDAQGRNDQEGDYRRRTTVTDVTSTGLASKRVRVQVWVRNYRTDDFDTSPEVLETIFTDIRRAVEVQ